MPFKIKQNDSRCPAGKTWSVVNSDTNKLHGCHPSKDAARQQQKALYANVPDAANGLRADAGEDPLALVAGLDSIMDGAIALVPSVDRTTAAPEVAQILDLVVAADATVDQLMDAMGVYDPDADAEGDESLMYDYALGLPYIIRFDYRSDDGPLLVGPFPTRDAAVEYVRMLEPFESEWDTVPVSKP